MPRAAPLVPLALALALALALVVPSVVADHAYSHRYLVYGRVVDSEGNAVPNVTVLVETRKFHPNPEGCESRDGSATDAFGRMDTRPVTNEFGEFFYCYHEHGMSRPEPGEATVSIPSLGYFTNITFDPYLRESIVPIVLDAPHPNATRKLDSTFTVSGRVWEPHPKGVQLEGNTVWGLTLVGSQINITLTLPDGTNVTNTTWSNDYGDFAVRLPVASRVTAGTVRIDTFGNYTINDTKSVDAKMGMTIFQTKLPEGAPSAARSIATIVALSLGAVIVVVALLLGGRALVKRRANASNSRAARRRNRR